MIDLLIILTIYRFNFSLCTDSVSVELLFFSVTYKRLKSLHVVSWPDRLK